MYVKEQELQIRYNILYPTDKQWLQACFAAKLTCKKYQQKFNLKHVSMYSIQQKADTVKVIIKSIIYLRKSFIFNINKNVNEMHHFKSSIDINI